jgi:serine/threonine-protein kinase
VDQSERIRDAADSVVSGTPADWDRLASECTASSELLVVRNLEAVAHIALICSELSGDAPAAPIASWGPLRIIRPLGAGSYADVYLAHDPSVDRPVALKLLRFRESIEQAVDSVVQEARLLARVRHPNVVAIYGVSRIDGRVGISMEFVAGQTLAREIGERGPLGSDEVARIGLDLCSALAAVHRSGVIHRDVKAQNVLRDHNGHVWLTDFGAGRELARAGASTDVAGTPLYVAPEILNGEAASVVSDVYSLGVLLHHLATGRFPVNGSSLKDLHDRHRRGARETLRSTQPNLPLALSTAIDRATSPDPARRFQSADAFGSALAPRSSPRYGASGFIAAAAASVIVAGIVTWLAVRSFVEPPPVVCRDCVDGDESISADARFLVRDDPWTGDLILRDLAAGRDVPVGVKDTRQLTHTFARQPVLSPTGRYVAYQWVAGDKARSDLQIFDRRSGRPRLLIANSLGQDVQPQDWRPDEKAILVLITRSDRSSELAWLPVDGGSLVAVASFAPLEGVRGRARVSPDGRYLTYAAADPRARSAGPSSPMPQSIYVLDLASRTTAAVVTTASANQGPVWTSDGRRVVYTSQAGDRGDLWSLPVDHGRAAGPPVVEAHDVGLNVPEGVVGGSYYYGKRQLGIDLTYLAPMRAIRADFQAATFFPGYQPVWSPDGKAIAFYRRNAGASEAQLIVRSVDTGEERVLHTGLSTLPLFWFGDGQFLLEQIKQTPGRPLLQRVDVRTGQTLRMDGDLPPGLTRTAEAALSRNGRTLYSMAHDPVHSRTAGPDRVIAIDVETGRVRFIVALEGPPETLPGGGGVAIGVDPDGSTLAIAAGNDRGTRLIRVGTDGTGYRELYGPYTSDSPYRKLDWSPDGKTIFFSVATPGVTLSSAWRVMGIDAHGGTAWPVTDDIAGGDLQATFSMARTRIALQPYRAAAQAFNPAAGEHSELRRIVLTSGK